MNKWQQLIRWRCAVFMLFSGLLLLAGCWTPGDYRRQADRAAAGILHRQQQVLFGRTLPIKGETAADTLRRRLLLDQKLTRTGAASLGVHDLPANRFWQPKRHLGQARPDEDKKSAVGQSVAGVLRLSLLDALEVGAANSRDYQTEKEKVFRAALALDLEKDAYRKTASGVMSGLLSSDYSGDKAVGGASGSVEAGFSRAVKSGATFTSLIAVDLVKLLTANRVSSRGISADASISIPLLRGAGADIAAEDLTQAEADVRYALWGFERFRRTYAVDVAQEYLSVLLDARLVENERENYRRLIAARRRARRLADAGRLPDFQHDQAAQDEFRARDRWIRARQNYASRLDRFKVLLGLPPDARVELDAAEVGRLQLAAEKRLLASGGMMRERVVPSADVPIKIREPKSDGNGFAGLTMKQSLELALRSRLDLRTMRERVNDAERQVRVAADALRAELTLLGTAHAGARRSLSSADSDNARLNPKDGSYSALLTLDLPFERTAERNTYRNRLLDLQRAVRDFQALEDAVKLAVREKLRNLAAARESFRIQHQAMQLARKRVKSTGLLLQAGRAQIRDMLESQEALLSAQNAESSALVAYRIAELELQRDLGVLQVDKNGHWIEFRP